MGVPKPIVFWSIEGERDLIFPGMNKSRFTATQFPEGRSVLTLNEVTRGDNGKVIVCSSVNLVGSASARVALTVNLQEEYPPPIIVHGPVNQTLPLKSLAIMECKAIGSPVPELSWFKDGSHVLPTDRTNISETGLLTITNLNKIEDSGMYTCVASSKSGKTTWSAYLRVESPTNPNIQFFRAPESNTFPEQPGKPQMLRKTENSVTLSWKPSIQIGSSLLLGYTISMFARSETEDWTNVAVRIKDLNFTQFGLYSGTTYYFIIRAENSHGLSIPSQMSEAVRVEIDRNEFNLYLNEARASLLSGDVVELLNSTSNDSTSLKLSWKVKNSKNK